MIITIIQILFCIWVAINLKVIIHNQCIITDNQNKILDSIGEKN